VLLTLFTKEGLKKAEESPPLVKEDLGGFED